MGRYVFRLYVVEVYVLRAIEFILSQLNIFYQKV